MNNKWVIGIITVAIIFGVLIITNAHFGISLGLGQKTLNLSLQ